MRFLTCRHVAGFQFESPQRKRRKGTIETSQQLVLFTVAAGTIPPQPIRAHAFLFSDRQEGTHWPVQEVAAKHARAHSGGGRRRRKLGASLPHVGRAAAPASLAQPINSVNVSRVTMATQARIAISRTHGRGAVVAAGMDAVKVHAVQPSSTLLRCDELPHFFCSQFSRIKRRRLVWSRHTLCSSSGKRKKRFSATSRHLIAEFCLTHYE